jgi:hypothetical protein
MSADTASAADADCQRPAIAHVPFQSADTSRGGW